jgi:POT family proton-dependent oligopeptide transporter
LGDSPKSSSDRWPAQIKYIVGNEACERFSYYGMRSILAGYITGEVLKGGLGQSVDSSTNIIHAFVAANYFMPLLGAYLSDKLIGRYHTILWVSLFYCAGHGVLACSDFAGGVHGKMVCLFVGLALIAFGSGGIKPCVSAFMGDQFSKDQSHLMQKAYGAFYWSINFGAVFAFLVIPWMKDHHGYSAAFAVPGILMAIATFIFWLGTKKYVRIPPTRETKTGGFLAVFFNALGNYEGPRIGPWLNILTTLGAPLFIIVTLMIVAFSPMGPVTRAIGWSAVACTALWYVSVLITGMRRKFDPGDNFWRGARGRYNEGEISAARSVTPILFVMAFIPIFWTLFDQSNSTWVLQGEKMTPSSIPMIFFSIHIGAEQMQSMNALLVMILVPLFTLGIYPYIGKYASPLRRMSFGMFVAASSYVIVALLQKQIESGAQLSIWWQTIPYIVLTAAEVLVSTTGLEFSFREAAPELKSTIMSFWLLTVTVGDLFVVGVTKLFSQANAGNEAASVSTSRFLLYAGLTLVVAVLFSVVASTYQYRDASAAEGK